MYCTIYTDNSDQTEPHSLSGDTGGSTPTTDPASIRKPPIRPASDQAVDELSLDDLFDVLRNSRRRRALRYLFTTDDRTATVGELSEHIASIENDTDTTLITSKQRKRVYIGLYQTHLPKLADLGMIEYERGRGIVTLLRRAEQVEPYLFDAQNTAGWKWWISAVLLLNYAVFIGFVAINYSAVASVLSALVTTGVLLGAMFYRRKSLSL